MWGKKKVWNGESNWLKGCRTATSCQRSWETPRYLAWRLSAWTTPGDCRVRRSGRRTGLQRLETAQWSSRDLWIRGEFQRFTFSLRGPTREEEVGVLGSLLKGGWPPPMWSNQRHITGIPTSKKIKRDLKKVSLWTCFTTWHAQGWPHILRPPVSGDWWTVDYRIGRVPRNHRAKAVAPSRHSHKNSRNAIT